MKKYPSFPPELIKSYSELINEPNCEILQEVEGGGHIHLSMGQPLWPDLHWCSGLREVAAILISGNDEIIYDVDGADALGYLVYYTVDSGTDEVLA